MGAKPGGSFVGMQLIRFGVVFEVFQRIIDRLLKLLPYQGDVWHLTLLSSYHFQPLYNECYKMISTGNFLRQE